MAMKRASSSSMDAGPALKLPKGIVAAREKLEALNLEITGPNLKQVLSPVERNKLGNVFRNGMSGEEKKTYKGLPNDEARSAILAQFVLDGDLSSLTGFNKYTIEKGEKQNEEGEWLLETQISTRLNSDRLANILCNSGEVTADESEFECFRKEGIKVYWVTRTTMNKWMGQKTEAGAVAEAALKPDELEGVKHALENAMHEAPKKLKAVKKGQKEESPEEKEFKAAVSAKGVSARKMKAMFEKFRKDANKHLAKVAGIEKKGLPIELATHCEAEIKKLLEEVESCAKFYGEEIIKADSSNVKDIENDTKQFDERTAGMETKYKSAKSGIFADVIKFTGK